MKREDQQDATIRCLLLTSVSTCFGHHYAHLQENKAPVTAFGVLFCNRLRYFYNNLKTLSSNTSLTPRSFYTRYVDDILFIYESMRTNPDNILQYIDSIHRNIQLSPTMESANNINFLDLSITKRSTCLNINILTQTYLNWHHHQFPLQPPAWA